MQVEPVGGTCRSAAGHLKCVKLQSFLGRQRTAILADAKKNEVGYVPSEMPGITKQARTAVRWMALSALSTWAFAWLLEPVFAKSVCQPRKALIDVPALARPTDGAVVRVFGIDRNLATAQLLVHTGIDFAGSPGSPVRAAFSGRTRIDRVGNGFGPELTIRKGLAIVRYRHLVISTHNGTCVATGQIIGHLSRRDRGKLHFELAVNARLVDPRRYLPR